MSRTFAELKGKVPGMPSELSAQQIAETKAKFAKHEKIVQAMTPEELADPNLMSMDLKDIENKCPRVQRLSRESGVSEKDVALFIAEFEVCLRNDLSIKQTQLSIGFLIEEGKVAIGLRAAELLDFNCHVILEVGLCKPQHG